MTTADGETPTARETADDALRTQALRLIDRYVREVVLGFGLCPWAEPALRAGRVARGACLAVSPTAEDCLPFIDRLAAAVGGEVQIGLLSFPRHHAGWAAFDSFAERVRRADRAGRGVSGSAPRARPLAASPFLVAAFHPDGAETFEGPHQLISFLRRTPDPMLQFVRAEVVDRLRESRPEASEDVGRRNHALFSTTGGGGGGGGGALDARAAFDEAVRDIRADRDASYARLGEPTR